MPDKDELKPFIYEYNTNESVSNYVKTTAGAGIEFLLSNVYGKIYADNINQLLKNKKSKAPLRILEFGCGAGMNLIYIINALKKHNIPVEAAYGTDFSEQMIVAAKEESKRHLSQEDQNKVKFAVASNENIQDELNEQCNVDENHFNGYFDLIIGVNTFRYSWRNKKEKESAQLLFNMLSKGGRVIVIDMNKGFPYYLTHFRNILSKNTGGNDGDPRTAMDHLKTILLCHNDLPTLEEYVEPFRNTGFEILQKEIFSWVAHSSGKIRLTITKALIPLLDKLIPDRAMRILLIGRKPLD